MAIVLVVEDNTHVQRYLLRVLSHGGYPTLLAEDGIEAIEVVQSTKVDVIISDVEMPRLDGTGFYSWILSNRPELAERFIFHTGNRDKLRSLTHVPVIEKGLDNNDVLGMIRKLTETETTV